MGISPLSPHESASFRKRDLRTQSAMAGRNGKIYSSRIRVCWTVEEGGRERNRERAREREGVWGAWIPEQWGGTHFSAAQRRKTVWWTSVDGPLSLSPCKHYKEPQRGSRRKEATHQRQGMHSGMCRQITEIQTQPLSDANTWIW